MSPTFSDHCPSGFSGLAKPLLERSSAFISKAFPFSQKDGGCDLTTMTNLNGYTPFAQSEMDRLEALIASDSNYRLAYEKGFAHASGALQMKSLDDSGISGIRETTIAVVHRCCDNTRVDRTEIAVVAWWHAVKKLLKDMPNMKLNLQYLKTQNDDLVELQRMKKYALIQDDNLVYRRTCYFICALAASIGIYRNRTLRKIAFPVAKMGAQVALVGLVAKTSWVALQDLSQVCGGPKIRNIEDQVSHILTNTGGGFWKLVCAAVARRGQHAPTGPTTVEPVMNDEQAIQEFVTKHGWKDNRSANASLPGANTISAVSEEVVVCTQPISNNIVTEGSGSPNDDATTSDTASVPLTRTPGLLTSNALIGDILSSDRSIDIFIPGSNTSISTNGSSGTLGFTYIVDAEEPDDVSVLTTATADFQVKIKGERPHSVGYVTDRILERVQSNIGTRNLSLMFDGAENGCVFVSRETDNFALKTIETIKPVPNLAKDCTCVRLKTPPKTGESTFLWFGPACATALPSVFSPSPHNEHAALVGRHLNSHNPDSLIHWRLAVKDVGHLIMKCVNMEDSKCETTDQWIAGQPTNKRNDYLKEVTQLDKYNFNDKKNHSRKSFLKAEVQIPPGWDENMADKFPRGIQGLTNTTINLVLGPFMKWVSKSLAYEFLNAKDGCWPQFGYTSGSTPAHIGSWYTDMQEAGFNFLEDDFSQYDSTQGQGCHESENWFYHQFPGHENAKRCVGFQKETVGFGNYYKYTCKYTRKSGDQNTSIGNTFVNFLAHAYAIHTYMVRYRVTVKYYMIGLGDDNVIATDVPKDNLEAFGNHISDIIVKMGLKPKLKVANRGTSYCSSEFVPLTKDGIRTHVLIPNVLRMMFKLGFTTSKLQAKDNLMRLKGNMLGNRYLQYMPVLRAFYQFYTSRSGQGCAEYTFRCHDMFVRDKYEMSEETFSWFEDIYGLNIQEVGRLESFLVGVMTEAAGRPCLYDHMLIHNMVSYRENVVDVA